MSINSIFLIFAICIVVPNVPLDALIYSKEADFAKIVESLGLQVVRALMLLIAFIPILWGLSSNVIIPFFKDISGSLVWVSLTASLGGLLISWIVGIKLQA